MKVKHLVILSILVLTFFSCEDFEDNRRVLIKAKVTNISEFVGEDVQVVASFEDRVGEFSSNEDIIGRSVVEANGEFQMLIPVPRNEEVHVAVNPTFENNFDRQFQVDVEIGNAVFSSPSFRNLVDLGEIEIPHEATLELNFIDESPEESTISWEISYSFASCNFIFDIEDILVIDQFCTQAFPNSGELTDESQSVNYPVTQNSTATLEYIVNDNAAQIIEIDLNESLNEITVTY